MQNIQSQSQKSISTSELANIFKTSNKVILENAKKCLNKNIENGVLTYFSEYEAGIIIKNIDYDNSQAKVPLLAGKGTVKTELMLKEEFYKQIEHAKQLPKEEKLTLALSTFQSLLEDLEKENKNKEELLIMKQKLI